MTHPFLINATEKYGPSMYQRAGAVIAHGRDHDSIEGPQERQDDRRPRLGEAPLAKPTHRLWWS